MSLEAFGDEGAEGIDVDLLYARGWESDADCNVWWRTGEPEDKYTIQQAWEAYCSWREDIDECTA